MSSTPRYPQLVAFDLDYTLWDLWIDTHISGPLHRDKDKVNEVLDRNNDVIAFYADVAPVFHRLKAAGVLIAACSRTSTPDLARQALRLLLVPPPQGSNSKPIPAIDFFDQLEIYPGSKIRHFKKLLENTGLPYSEMLFFDDEHRNKEVEKLGVTFQLVSSPGFRIRTFERGLTLWRERHPLHEADGNVAE